MTDTAMNQEILQHESAHLVHLGAMPGEAEIMVTSADNTLPADTDFKTSLDTIRKKFGI